MITHVEPKTIAGMLMFVLHRDDRTTRTNPAVQALSRIRADMDAQASRGKSLESAMNAAQAELRAALVTGISTATARAEIDRIRGEISAIQTNIARLHELAEQVRAEAIDFDSHALVSAAQAQIDEDVAPFTTPQESTTYDHA